MEPTPEERERCAAGVLPGASVESLRASGLAAEVALGKCSRKKDAQVDARDLVNYQLGKLDERLPEAPRVHHWGPFTWVR